MSFILEALKKADKNRKNNEVPNLQTVHQLPVQQPSRRPIWPLLLGAVLLLNALVLLWIIAPWKKDVPQAEDMASTQPKPGNIRSQVAAPPATSPAKRPVLAAVDSSRPSGPPAEAPLAARIPVEKTAPVLAVSEAGINTPTEKTSTLSAAPLRAKEKDAPQTGGTVSPQPKPASVKTRIATPPAKRPALAVVDSPRPSEPPTEVSSAARAPVEKPAPIPATREAGVSTPAEKTSTLSTASLPAPEKEANRTIIQTGNTGKEGSPVYELDQLPRSVRNGIPPTHMSVHYYTDHSPSRMVRLNGQILREGGRMESGPLVEEISPDGVILRFEGYRFLIPRAVPE